MACEHQDKKQKKETAWKKELHDGAKRQQQEQEKEVMLQQQANQGSKQGLMIVFEGADRSGKTAQLKLLEDKMKATKLPYKVYKFPDRTTATGKMLDVYLQDKTKTINATALHLIFAGKMLLPAETTYVVLLGFFFC